MILTLILILILIFLTNKNKIIECLTKENNHDNILDCVNFCDGTIGCKGILYNRLNSMNKCFTTDNDNTLNYYQNIKNKNKNFKFDIYKKNKNKNYILNDKKRIIFPTLKNKNKNKNKNYYKIDKVYKFKPTQCYMNSQLWTRNKCNNTCIKDKYCSASAKRIGYDIKSSCCSVDPKTANKLEETGYFNVFYK
jgi:hypothetical protein